MIIYLINQFCAIILREARVNTLIEKIAPEHLQYANHVTHYNPMGFLNAMDVEATNGKYREELRIIPPSYLGTKIIEFSKEDLVEGSDPRIRELTHVSYALGYDAETSEGIAKKIIQTEKSGIFLWAGATFVATLYAANSYECPYMPMSWIEQFFREKKGLTQSLKEEYWGNILEQIKAPLDGELLNILHFASHELGLYTFENLILIIGSFLDQIEEANTKKNIRNWKKEMSPDVIKALEGIDFSKI